jgi:ArsR family transcriptional regulator, arsenate/arsenite/antimonite-responsive transcriptional repressor
LRPGFVVQERRGREVINRADYAAMRRVLGYLTENCCAGHRCRAPTPPEPFFWPNKP